MEKIRTIRESGFEIRDIELEETNLEETDRQFEEVEGQVREINGEAESHFSQIRNLIIRLIGHRGKTLGGKVCAIIRKQGATAFAVFTLHATRIYYQM